MGLNILLYKVLEETQEETWGGKMVPYVLTEDVDWWDSGRYTGDTDFVTETEFTRLGEKYYRPKDFLASKDWVKENVVKMNQKRLLEALNQMELDESLYFVFSW